VKDPVEGLLETLLPIFLGPEIIQCCGAAVKLGKILNYEVLNPKKYLNPNAQILIRFGHLIISAFYLFRV
jgi:hypothetical protein